MSNPYQYSYVEHNPSRTYTDLNLSFVQHPLTKDVAKKTNAEAIKQSMKTLLLLGKNEKPFHPEISGGIYEMLFENIAESDLDIILKKRIRRVLSSFEPRVEIRSVKVNVNTDQNGLDVTVYFVIANTLEPVTLDLFLKTIR